MTWVHINWNLECNNYKWSQALFFPYIVKEKNKKQKHGYTYINIIFTFSDTVQRIYVNIQKKDIHINLQTSKDLSQSLSHTQAQRQSQKPTSIPVL